MDLNTSVLHKTDYIVKTVPLITCQELIAKHHYAKTGSNIVDKPLLKPYG